MLREIAPERFILRQHKIPGMAHAIFAPVTDFIILKRSRATERDETAVSDPSHVNCNISPPIIDSTLLKRRLHRRDIKNIANPQPTPEMY